MLPEVLVIASNTAPGLFRERFGFERWPNHRAGPAVRLREEARAAIEMPKKLVISGWDRDGRAVSAARKNLEAAGLSELVTVEGADARAFCPKPGWNAFLVTNPPYGERVGSVDKLLGMFRDFGGILRRDATGYRVALLSGHPALKKALGFRPEVTVEVRNGPLDCELLMFTI